MSKTAGLAGSVMCAAGVVAFFAGIFGAPRVLAFIGLGLMTASIVAFFVEEQGARRAAK